MRMTSKEVGMALKAISERLREENNKSIKSITPKHICTNCKYRGFKTYVTEDWGVTQIYHNWCKLDKKNMETYYNHGNDNHFTEPCEYFESL